MIATDHALATLCSELKACGAFGFDTEFIRERSYVPQLCLIQAAPPGGRPVLVDPLEVDPQPFWNLVLDPAVQKVVHAGEQDLELCFRHTGRLPQNIFDVQIAAGFVGLEYPLSYSRLVEQLTGREVPTGSSFSEWGRRPLEPKQIAYASADVEFLMTIRDDLAGRLAQAGRESWLAEEMAEWSAAESYEMRPEHAWLRVRGGERMRGKKLAALRELACWREKQAERQDVPPRTCLGDDVLRRVAREKPETVDDLAALKGFPRPLARRRGKEVLAAMRRGLKTPLDRCPPQPLSGRSGSEDKPLVDALMAAGREACAAAGVSHELFGSRAGYQELVYVWKHPKQDWPAPKLIRGWRKELAGAALQHAWQRARG